MFAQFMLAVGLMFLPAIPFIIVIGISEIRDRAYVRGHDEAWNRAAWAQSMGRTIVPISDGMTES
jgi:hypothetical protein